jgi:hypothetical protein
MSEQTARRLYDGYRAVLVTVAAGIAAWTISGALNDPQGGPALPQEGRVVTSYDSSRVTFNHDVLLDRSQVGAGR